MYRFALRPLWLLSHAFVVVLVVLCINLGFWQLRRHDERAARNDAVAERSERPAVPVQDLLDPAADDLESLRYRPVTAAGTFVPDAQFFVDNRSADGLPGAWVVAPLRLDTGDVVAVSRGFLSFEDGELDAPPVPPGRVEIGGTVTPWDDPCGMRTDDAGAVVGAGCLHREAAERVAGADLLPVAIQQRRTSAGDTRLVPVPLPEPDAGPHRSYAFQWFTFATIGTIGYPIVLRKVARDRAKVSEPSTRVPESVS